MGSAVAAKPEEKQGKTAERAPVQPEGQQWDQTVGAPTGLPLFLQNARSSGSTPPENPATQDQVSKAPGAPALGRGEPLPSPLRQEMAGKFGVPLDNIRVHNDSESSHAARKLEARAFVVGTNIHFARGAYNPGSVEGRRLIAHEVAHVAQQKTGTPPVVAAALRVSTPDSAAEREARSVADHPRPVSVPANTGTIYRDSPPASAPEPSASEFLTQHGSELSQALMQEVAKVHFTLDSPYASWTPEGESLFKLAVSSLFGDRGRDYQNTLIEALRPTPAQQTMDAVRRGIATAQDASAIPDVAAQLSFSIGLRTQESLTHMLPRYLRARNQAALALSYSIQIAPQPNPASLVASTPADLATIRGLLIGSVAFDQFGYQTAHPEEATLPAGGLKSPGQIEFLVDQGMGQWLRVSNPEATAEDVAAEIYGSSTLSYRLVAAAPLFHFEPSSLIDEPYFQQWADEMANAGRLPEALASEFGFDQGSSPADELGKDPLSNEILLAQANAFAPTGLSPLQIVEQMRIGVRTLDGMALDAAKFKLEKGLTDVRARLDERSRTLHEKLDDPDTERWSAQAAAQNQTLFRAGAGFQWAVSELSNYASAPDAAVPAFVMDPLQRAAEAYAEAAENSELATTGQQYADRADALAVAYPFDLADGVLAQIRDGNKGIAAGKTDALGGDPAVFEQQEAALRSQVARARAELISDPKHAAEILKQLEATIGGLSRRVAAVNTLSKIDALNRGILDHIVIVQQVNSLMSSPTQTFGGGEGEMMPQPNLGQAFVDQQQLQPFTDALDELFKFRQQWAPIAKAAFTASDADLKGMMEAAAPQREPLMKAMERAQKLINDYAESDRMGKLMIAFTLMLYISLASFGFGEFVAGAAIGAELVTEGGVGAWLIGTSSEALAMTTLTAAMQGKEGFKHFGADFLWNWGTIGAMRGVSGLFRGVAGGLAKTIPGQIAETLASLSAAAAIAVLKQEYDTHRDTGHWLTDAQRSSVIRESLIQGAAMAIGTRVAGAFMPSFRDMGGKLGQKIKAANSLRDEVRGLQSRVVANPKDTPLARELTALDTQSIHEEAAVALEAAAEKNLTSEQQAEVGRVQEQTATEAQKAAARTVATKLQAAGPKEFVYPHGELPEAKAYYEGLGDTVTPGPTDPVTQDESIIVSSPETKESFQVTEQASTDEQSLTKPPETAAEAAKPPKPPAAKFKTLDDILTPDKKGFLDPDLQKRYDAYRAAAQKRGTTDIAEPEVWARSSARGDNQEALEKLLGPDFRRKGVLNLLDIFSIFRPAAYSDAELSSHLALLRAKIGRFARPMRNFIREGIQKGKVNVGYFWTCKGIVAEILAEGFMESVLAKRQAKRPGAQLIRDVYAITDGQPQLFTDGLIGAPEGDNLQITDRFEVKSGRQGGATAEEQFAKWVERKTEDGTKLLINKKPFVSGEPLGPGQEHIGKFVYDVYYWNPTEAQLKANPNLRTVIGLSGNYGLHVVMPEGAEILSADSGERTVPVKITELPATASEIDYLTRVMMEDLALTKTAPAPAGVQPDPK
jgi:Domain of unknown function (DUF4157)